MLMRYIVICGLCSHTVFFHITSQVARFSEKFIKPKIIFWFCLQLFRNISYSKKKWSRYNYKCVLGFLSSTSNFENCALLGHYAASTFYLLPKFRYNISVQSSGVKNPKKKSVIPIGRLYRDRCSWRKVSVVWCQPIRLTQVIWWEGSVVVSAAVERDFEC